MYLREHLALMTKGAIAASGAGGIIGLIGLVLLMAEGAHSASGWIVLAGGFLVLFLAQIWAVQRAIDERESAQGAGGSITGVGIGESASVMGLTFTGNVQTIESGSAASRRRGSSRRWRLRKLDEVRRERLRNQGWTLSERLFSFAADRRRMEPERSFPPHESTGEQMHAVWVADSLTRDKYSTETTAQFHEEFTGDIAAWLDEVDECGGEIPKELQPRSYLMLAGVSPLETLASNIAILAARIGRQEIPWWRWRERKRAVRG